MSGACPSCQRTAVECTGRNREGRPLFRCADCKHAWAARRGQSDRFLVVARAHHRAVGIRLPIVDTRA